MIPDTESNQSDGGKPAVGFGPNHAGAFSQADYFHPAAGWGAAISVSKVLLKQGELIDGTRVVFKMNHENGGYDCPGCAWPDDRKGLTLDICENGIKHATWEMTHGRVNRDFFAAHTVKELMGWTDYALQKTGRLFLADQQENRVKSTFCGRAIKLCLRCAAEG